ncbi:MAG: OmpA family protein [Gammaproteobacteria bacterium]|nr:OmpA family protein [Gammaproteobacteria bacterium]
MRSRSHSILHAAITAVLLALPPAAQILAEDAAPGEGMAAETSPRDTPAASGPGAQFEFIPLRHVFFEHDRAQLGDQARRILDDAALYLRHATGIDRVIIQGHADYTAGEIYNDKLSDQRMGAVRDYLAGQGVEADLLRAGGLGEHVPIDENWTRDGRARNRRVEIYIVRHADLP